MKHDTQLDDLAAELIRLTDLRDNAESTEEWTKFNDKIKQIQRRISASVSSGYAVTKDY